MTNRKTTLIPKYPFKGTDKIIYRSITCLPMMYKIIEPQIRENIYWL